MHIAHNLAEVVGVSMVNNGDCITRPLETVAGLFRATGSNEAGDWGVTAIFAEKLADPATLVQVGLRQSCPSLNFADHKKPCYFVV